VDAAWRDVMAAFAADSAAIVKVSIRPPPAAFAAYARHAPNGFPAEGLRRHMDTLLDTFGPDRLVWGSDWPVSRLTGEAPASKEGWHELLDPVAVDLSATAARVYRLGPLSLPESPAA
jgi:L-fuconolactonase